jgi:hypothetical protein
MKNTKTIAVVISISLFSLASVVNAEVYHVSEISHIHTNSTGVVHIKWVTSPRPYGPCGANNGWVAIPPSAPQTMKDLAYSLYFYGHAARIDTKGCHGQKEKVESMYSPGG